MSFETLFPPLTLSCDSTSPSFYLHIVGPASVSDSCGTVGSVYTDPIVAVPLGNLSTVSLQLPPGVNFVNNGKNRAGVNSWTEAVRTEDLLCPTWGLANRSEVDRVTVGPLFNPIIHPPPELVSFDPAWRKCTKWAQTANKGGTLMYEVYDPPRILSRVSKMGSSTNAAGSITSTSVDSRSPSPPSPPSPIPADRITPALPEATSKASFDPGHWSSTHPDSPSSAGSGTTLLGGADPVTSGHSILSPASSQNLVTKPEQGHSSNHSQTASTNSKAVLTIAGQTVKSNPSAFGPDDSALSTGRPGITISGTPVSLEPLGTLAVGGSDVALAGNGTFARGGGNGSQEFSGGQGRIKALRKAGLVGTVVVVLRVIQALGARGL